MGRKPNAACSPDCTGRIAGTSTNRPHRPMITLGIAASNSMRNEAGALSQRGDSSARKMAAPMLTGTAMRRARKELSRVPKMAGSAPNCWRTTSHAVLQTNDGPNRVTDGQASILRMMIVPSSIPMTMRAKTSVEREKRTSPMPATPLRVVRALARAIATSSCYDLMSGCPLYFIERISFSALATAALGSGA